MGTEIGAGKTARRAYGFDEIAIVPSRRTRDPEDVDISWTIGGRAFPLPLVASAMDSVMSPESAIELGRLGGLGVVNLEGLYSRYPDAHERARSVASLPTDQATHAMQRMYDRPIDPELLADAVRTVREAGVVAAGSLTPQHVESLAPVAIGAGLDILVIQGTVVSAEHVSSKGNVLDLHEFIASIPIPVIVGGCASFQSALHLMRTGAAGVLVGVGPGAACTTRGVLGVGVPQATAIADVAGARQQYLNESGRYVSVIADGGMRTGGDISKAVACGADAVMIGSPLARAAEAPGNGYHWGMATFHPTLPRGTRVHVGTTGGMREIVLGPARENDGRNNLMGALRTSMATCGYESIPAFQQAEVVLAPTIGTEGKALQREQQVGMA